MRGLAVATVAVNLLYFITADVWQVEKASSMVDRRMYSSTHADKPGTQNEERSAHGKRGCNECSHENGNIKQADGMYRNAVEENAKEPQGRDVDVAVAENGCNYASRIIN